MGWTRRANPKWSDRHGMTANHRKETCYDIQYDRQGNTRWNYWAYTWTSGSTRWAKRNTNRQQRAADKLKIIVGIEDHFDVLEDHGQTFNWLGESEDQQELNWYDSVQEEYEQMLEDERREREYEQEMSDYWYDEPVYYDDYPLF